jgi:hypothetical protein
MFVLISPLAAIPYDVRLALAAVSATLMLAALSRLWHRHT